MNFRRIAEMLLPGNITLILSLKKAKIGRPADSWVKSDIDLTLNFG